jgi:hypothetical protein
VTVLGLSKDGWLTIGGTALSAARTNSSMCVGWRMSHDAFHNKTYSLYLAIHIWTPTSNPLTAATTTTTQTNNDELKTKNQKPKTKNQKPKTNINHINNNNDEKEEKFANDFEVVVVVEMVMLMRTMTMTIVVTVPLDPHLSVTSTRVTCPSTCHL